MRDDLYMLTAVAKATDPGSNERRQMKLGFEQASGYLPSVATLLVACYDVMIVFHYAHPTLCRAIQPAWLRPNRCEIQSKAHQIDRDLEPWKQHLNEKP